MHLGHLMPLLFRRVCVCAKIERKDPRVETKDRAMGSESSNKKMTGEKVENRTMKARVETKLRGWVGGNLIVGERVGIL